MHIVLSRKSMDSRFGGYPSPIMPDGTLIPFPIPQVLTQENNPYSKIYATEDKTFAQLFRTFNDSRSQIIRPFIKNGKKKDYAKNCHLDPDLFKESKTRIKGWRPSLGQVNQANSHLKSFGIGKESNALFLFFGWFRKVKRNKKNNKLQFYGEHYHLIYAYLEVEKRIDIDLNEKFPKWAEDHPHIQSAQIESISNNSLYIAKDKSTLINAPGSQILKFDNKRILTAPGETRSRWKLPEKFKKVKISYHESPSVWKEKYFQSNPIGQEFVFEENKGVINWAKKIVS